MHCSLERSPSRALVLPAILVALLLILPAPAAASDYDPDESGNPVYIAGTIAYPLGYAYENLILRPGRWLGDQTPIKQIFGQDTLEDTYDW
ncbi:MAG: hypothetical protein Q8R92_20475 [Deltaproteobacteria bacterium]|nr:hypothetical protein [Deltaproteobacteria bacterium]